MMKLKKFMVTISALCLASLSLAGCGKKQDSNKLVVGTNAEFPPFEYVSVADGVVDKYAGIDIEIVKKVAEDNGMKIEINNMEFDSLTVALSNGQISCAIAGMTITEERNQLISQSHIT